MRVKITNWKQIGASVLLVSAVFVLLSLQTRAASQSDAIAVRVLPNTNHDSIETWYAKQGFVGSPQSLIVDGYEAIRDGRTVFVNAANLDLNAKNIYTNIYLISYNQESEEKTLDILGQLVSHWKFNNNVATPGTCSVSTLNCQADSDCPNDYLCSNTNSSADYQFYNKGKCVLKSSKVCVIDSDCPVNLFCDSLKARSIRDVSRLGKINQITGAIESYKNSNGKYPSLQSGTYILGSSLSVWPSWKETLWPQLGLSQLIIDPINTLGYCEGYDATTCWDNKNNTFVNSNLSLPGGSYAFIYTAAKNGINYFLCSVFETKQLGFDTQDKKISANSCAVNNAFSGSTSNTAPYVVSSYTNGETGKEFNGYIKIKDDEGDLISWNLGISSPGPWISSGWQSGPNLIPVLQDTGDSNQKKIYAPHAGNPGSYDMILTLTDSRGAATTTKLTLTVNIAGKPIIEAQDATYFVDPINPLKYTFSVEGSNSKPTYTFLPLNNYPLINQEITKAVSNASVTSVGLNKNKIDLSILIPTSTPIIQDMVIPVRITATANGVSSTKDINLNFKIEKPYLDFTCENMARIGQVYPISGNYCLIGKIKIGNHELTYSAVNDIRASFYIGGEDVYLRATSVDAIGPVDSSEIKVSVTNEYGASTTKSFNLKLNTFCGDNLKQSPNTEGRGGLYNNGVEECDGFDGVWTATTTMTYTPTIQYACTSGLNIPSPYPILDNNSCVFKGPTEGGGYCGDGYCQHIIKDINGDSQEMETSSTCPQDCGEYVCAPNCKNNICGSDGCGGTCGDCDNGEGCVGGSCCSTTAHIQVSADNEHKSYFNGFSISTGTDWTTVQAATTTIILGQNVFAIDAKDWAVSVANASSNMHGVSATFNLSGCRSKVDGVEKVIGSLSMNTDSIDKWKCTENLDFRWLTSNYNDSAWPTAESLGNTGPNAPGNALPYKQIWAADETSLQQSAKEIYCRYTFSVISSGCLPSCAGYCGGSDGCGGSCPDNCKSSETCGGSGEPNVCGEELELTCVPKCAAPKCGGSDGCGSVCPNTCGPSGQCITSDYTSCKQLLKKATTTTVISPYRPLGN